MQTKSKIKEWRERSKEALEKEIFELKEKLRALRFLLSSGKLKNVRELREAKKDIARILTIIKSKQTP
jgi:ribosomal protein L29